MRMRIGLSVFLTLAAGLLMGAGLLLDNTKGEVAKTSGATTTTIAGTTAAAPLGGYSNLVVISNSVNYVGITADYLVLTDGTPSAIGDAKTTGNVSVSALITTAGVNGLDGGAEGASLWYAVWVINNGTTTSALLSLSSTAPTMPSGYTYKRRVGWVRNDGSSNFVTMQQIGFIVTSPLVSIVDAGTATSNTDLDLSAIVPTTARQAMLVGLTLASASVAVQSTNLTIVDKLTGLDHSSFDFRGDASSTSWYTPISVIVPLNTNRVFQYRTGTNNRGTIYVIGWHDSL